MTILKRKNSYALNTLAAVILTSGLLRLSYYDISVQAQIDGTIPVLTEQILDIPFSTEAIDQILDALQTRESLILVEEERLESRRQTLNRTRTDVLNKIEELTAVEQRLAATLSLADEAAEQDLQRLVSVYENIKPKDAAELFAEMTPDFAAGFLSLMNPEISANILAELDPAVGHTISVIAAGRNVNAFQE